MIIGEGENSERCTTSPSNPRFNEEQQAAFAKAIFDNDYADIERLKVEGKWIEK